MFLRALAAFATLTLAWPAAAQPEDPEGALVEELVVQALEPGPAWWRVGDADSTVYILGGPEGPLPPNLRWDRRALDRRLAGAHSMIGGASMQAGVRDVPALLKLRSQLRSKTPLEETLAEPVRRRFVAARERAGRPAKRYADWTPLVAGQLLASDSREGKGWVNVGAQVREAAKRRKVPIRSSAKFNLIPFARAAMASLTPAVHQQCLEGALSDVEAGAGPARAAAEGWARGDTARALGGPRSFDRCLLILAGGADLWRRMARNQAADIAQALNTPGHAVAVVGLRRLLAEDGVIAQLQARGLTVAGPGEALPEE